MKIGLVGLGRMGANMRERLRRAGHEVVGYDRDPERRDVDSMAAMVESLDGPRLVWVMVPHGEPTRSTIAQLAGVLSAGDLVIDGGNSHFADDAENATMLGSHGIGYLDVGVSGGIWGLENGYALMVGGAAEHVAIAQPIFDALKPPNGGFAHAGPVGAGHYAKMVHNGIEYGLMQAYAEGYELLTATGLVTDVPAVLSSWTEGTVVRSWLLDLLVKAVDEDPDLSELSGYVEDSGEGRWTLDEAVRHAVPMPVLAAALFNRFSSRQDDSTAMKAVAALRKQFGGHATRAGKAPAGI